jgi:hypothetical protein
VSSLKVCALYDSQLGAFNRPMFVQSTGLAVRSFIDEVKRVDGNNPLHAHPEDFLLYHVADWEEDTATFDNIVPPVILVKGLDVL